MVVVSVITPAYQSADVLPRAIKSVQAQTLQDWEMIIVDDGSTDNTRTVVESFQQNDERIRYVYQENQGPGAARNKGAEQASGDYIAFLDADDEWLEHKLEGQVNILASHNDIHIVITDSLNNDLVNNTSIKYSEQHRKTLSALSMTPLPDNKEVLIFDDSESLRSSIYTANFINTSTSLLRLQTFQLYGGFDPICMGTEDHDLWLRLTRGAQFAYWSRVCAIRYKDSKSLSWRNEKWLREQIRLHEAYFTSDDYNDLQDETRRILKHTYRSLVRYYGRHFKPVSAYRTWRDSLKYGFDRQTVIFALAAFLGPLPFLIGGQLSRFKKRLRQ